MSFTSLLDRTASITRAAQLGTRDRGGNLTWEDADPIEVPCRIEQTASEEITVGRTTEISTHTGFFPAGTAFDASDRIEVDGITYRLVGAPSSVHGYASEHHVEAKLQVVT